MSMNVTSLLVIQMLCVLTHLGPSHVNAIVGTLEMEQLAQVSFVDQLPCSSMLDPVRRLSKAVLAC